MADWSRLPERVRFDRERGGTPASADMAKAIKAKDRGMVVLAQGNHHPTYNRMSSRLRQVFSYRTKPHPVYNGHPGGPAKTREALSGWMNRFFGLPESTERAFLIQQQGRVAIKALFESISSLHDKQDKYVLMPNLRWKFLDSLIKPFGLKIKDYDVTSPDIADAISRTISECGGPEAVAAISLNAPGNPTGRHYSASDYEAIKKHIDALNASLGDAPKIVIVHDDPYVGSNKIRRHLEDEGVNGSFLETGYEGGFQEWQPPVEEGAESNPLTPEAFVFSLSKLAEEAANGRSAIHITDSKLAKLYGGVLITAGSLGYSHDMMRKSCDAFGGDYDGDFIERCDQTAQMLEKNAAILRKKFGDQVVPGGLNITQLIRQPRADLIGREVDGGSAGRIVLADEIDVAEELANGYGVGLVPQQFDPQTAKPALFDPANDILIRFVLAASPREFSMGVDRAAKGFEEIRHNAPALV